MSDPGRQAADAVRTGVIVEPVSADRSLGQLVAEATTELSGLVHDEIALAKAEIRQDVKRGAIGGGAIAVAGILALFSLPVFSFAAAYGIHNWGLGLAWSFLIVGGAFVVLSRPAGRVRRTQVQEDQAAGEVHRLVQGDGVRPPEREAPPPGVGQETKSVARSSA